MTYPIVLAHGICRFDELLRRVLDDEDRSEDATHYFRRIRSTLEANGFTVRHSSVPWAESVRNRALVLKREVQRVLAETGASKVHIIAHSMGGLDARHMLYDHRSDGMHEKVASLTTLGTPHLGTTFADWGITSSTFALAALRELGIDRLDGFRDLTTAACAEFDRDAESFERSCGVRFTTYAGAQEASFVFSPLKLPWHLIRVHEGPNDGLVSVASARWRDEYFRGPIIDADHLNQLGWWEPEDIEAFGWPPGPPRGETRVQLQTRIRALYLEIARRLASEFPS